MENLVMIKSRITSTPFRVLINPIVWCALVSLMLMAIIAQQNDPLSFFRMKEGTDFNSVYYASERLLLGDNIYYPQDQEYIFANEYGRGRYIPPPLAAYIYLPLTLFDYSLAFALHSYICFLMLVFILVFMVNLIGDKGKYLAYLLPFFFSFAFWAHIERGQYYLPAMVCLVLVYYFFLKQREVLSGIMLALAISFKVTPAIFLFYFLIRNRKIFFYTILFSLIIVVLTGVGSNFEFLYNFRKMNDAFSTGILNDGLFPVLSHYLSYLHNSFTSNRYFIDFLIFVLAFYFFSIFYKRKTVSNPIAILYEFGVLSSLAILIPHISYIYNGVLILFIFLFYVKVRSKDYLNLNQILLLDFAFLFFLAPPNVFIWVWLQPILVLRPVILVLILLVLEGPYERIVTKSSTNVAELNTA